MVGSIPAAYRPTGGVTPISCTDLSIIIILAKKAVAIFIVKALRLYEQEPPCNRDVRLGECISRWIGWIAAILSF